MSAPDADVAGGRRAPAAPGGRIPGIDLARALAILGMFAVHIGPTRLDGLGGTLYALPHGRAAILFGLLAGVGVSLLAASRTTSPLQARLRLLWRAAILLPLGLALQPLDHNVFVILQDYALLFLVGIVVLGLGDRWLLALAASVAALGSLGYLWGQIHHPEAFERQAAAWGDSAGELAHRLVLSGPYPLITWAAPFLLGMWLGRRDLRRTTVRLGMVAGGLGAAVAAWGVSWVLVGWLGEPLEPVGWGQVIIDDPHSQMPLWLVGSTGSAVLVLGGSLLVADRARRATWPLVATGQLAFTVYVGHLLALHRWNDALTSAEVGNATGLVLAFALVAAGLSVLWRSRAPRGPLESLLHLPWTASWPPGRRAGPGPPASRPAGGVPTGEDRSVRDEGPEPRG